MKTRIVVNGKPISIQLTKEKGILAGYSATYKQFSVSAPNKEFAKRMLKGTLEGAGRVF